jgi:hypothetical protein
MRDIRKPDPASPSALGPGGIDSGALEAELAALSRADVSTLRARWRWRRLYRTHPPRTLRRDLLELAVGWKLQELSLGGMNAVTKRQLGELARTLADKKDRAAIRKVTLKPGEQIVRVWGGETHEVVVVEDGFLWRDKIWNSLSVIAREITGARWSGPRFFGLDRTGIEARLRSRHGSVGQ